MPKQADCTAYSNDKQIKLQKMHIGSKNGEKVSLVEV